MSYNQDRFSVTINADAEPSDGRGALALLLIDLHRAKTEGEQTEPRPGDCAA